MENLPSFYNTLLGIEVSAIGIIIAAIFVFIQLVYSRFSYREVRYIIFDKYLLLFLFLSFFVISFTSLASLSLALGSHDFFKSHQFYTQYWITNPNIILALLILLLATIVSFLFLIISNLKYLQPSRLIYISTQTWNINQIKKFLHKKYGIPEPYQSFSIMYQFNDPTIEEVREEIEEEIKSDITGEVKIKKEKSEKRKELEKKAEEDGLKHQEDVKQHKELEKQVTNSSDPFIDTNQIALDALAKLDLRTYQIFLSEIENISENFFTSVKSIPNNTTWDPEKNISENFLRQITEMYKSHLEIADQQGLHSVRLIILDSTRKIASSLMEDRFHNALTYLASFWKRMADIYMQDQPEVFKRVVKNFRETTETLLRENNNGEIANEMFRDIGWLGEKLFIKQTIEEEPLMPDDTEQSNQFDDLMNAILSFENIYTYSHPDWYPLIYFDAVDVILLRLIKVIKENTINIQNAESSLFNLLYVYFSFGKAAITASNREGAELAALNLSNSIQKLGDAYLEEKRNNALDLLLNLGAFAAGHEENLQGKSIFGRPLDDWIIEKLMPYMSAHNISSEILEIYIKGEGNKKGIKKYIVKLSDQTGRDFGLNIEALRQDSNG